MMGAELVETSRLFARTDAAIDPAWAEALAGDLAKRSYSEPHWEKKQGAVVAYERVTLFGVPIVAAAPRAARAHRPGATRASCSSATRSSRASGTSPARQRLTAFDRANRELRARARARSRSARAAATSWSTTRRSSSSTTRASPRDVIDVRSLRGAGGRTRAADTPDLLTMTARRPARRGRRRDVDERDVPATLAAGRPAARARATASSRAPRTTA